MIDLDRLRNARDADYQTGKFLCEQAADEIASLREKLDQFETQLRGFEANGARPHLVKRGL